MAFYNNTYSEKRRTVICNHIEISFFDKPSGRTEEHADTIVLLHGLSMDSRVWENQLEASELSHLRIIAIDLPGHGASARSDQPALDYTFASLGNSLKKLLQELDVQHYVLAGISLGANLALQSLPDLPGCKGVFASVVPFSKPLNLLHFRDPSFLLQHIYIENVARENLVVYCNLQTRPGTIPPSFLLDAFEESDPGFRSAILANIGSSEYSDENEKLDIPGYPVALILGEEDQLCLPDVVKTFAYPQIWKGGVQWIPKAGHMPQWENPTEFNNVLSDFVKHCFEKA